MPLPDLPPNLPFPPGYDPATRKIPGVPKRPKMQVAPAALPVPDVVLKAPLLPEPEAYRAADRSAEAANDPVYRRLAVENVTRIAAELARREQESLRLYEPLESQRALHACTARTRMARGGNRGGKSLACAVELARAVTNADPYAKYPRKGTAVIAGKDFPHLGLTIYPMLFQPGAFKIVRDRDTNLWRAFRPWDKGDATRDGEARTAPPLIPKRLIKGKVAWHSRSKKQPSRIDLTTGWSLHFFSGEGEPPKGFNADFVWLDEEIKNGDWYREMNSRIADTGGRILWSATPQNATQQYYELSLAADQQKRQASPTVVEFQIGLAANPHIREAAKRELAESLSPEQAAVRVHGEFSLGGQRVYPGYSVYTHGLRDFAVPDDWTRLLAVDPGYQIGAVIFAAVPPPGDEKFPFKVYVYDELYIDHCSAEKMAAAVLLKVEGKRFDRFIIDTRGSRGHQAGNGKTINEQYAAAFAALNIRSVRTGSQFEWGSDDLSGGIEMVRRMLTPDAFGRPELRFACTVAKGEQTVRPVCQNLDWELQRYRRKKGLDEPTDDTDERGRVHLCAALRYLVMASPRYVPPSEYGDKVEFLSPAVRAFRQFQARTKKPGLTVFGPAGSAA